ncbi:uncharacterized protein LOC124542776 [Vanessa cardui]|uniref:uncharacterized protein LOC124542776 n=1 Tax=Vanessa cardui TaxID=171605 RepID=UPI001F140962|nr:uncharacterized protein LOC124542776 [Vanessa cardui]
MLINLNNNTPNENETIVAYASRLMTTLTNCWKDASKDQIAIATILAHISQLDPKLQRLAFTTDITSRDRLQQELQAFTHMKRKANISGESSKVSDIKRAKISLRCYTCGKMGHKRSECRSKANDSKGGPTRIAATSQPPVKSLVCFKCGKPGHIAVRCTSVGGSGPGDGSGAGAARDERRVDVCVVQPPSNYLEHRGNLYLFHYDSGAEYSLVKERVAAKLCGKRFNNVIAMTGIGQSRVFSTEQILCCVTINGHSFEILLHVLPDNYLQSDIMIGREILSLGLSITMTATNFSLHKIPSIIMVEYCTEQQSQIISVVNTDVNNTYKSELLKILNRFSNFFITGMPTTRVTTGELNIRLIDPNRTVQRRPYKMSIEERSILRNRIRELLNANIIRPSCSPFASPAILVKKHDGSDRMCIDYRELNNNTVPDRYPLPLISDQISRLSGSNYFSQLDCASGFHSIPVNVDSIEKTAFITPDGQYEFLTMPFGLKNAISVFQRAIMNALGDLAHDYVIVYVDDVLITSPDVESGLERLNVVLEILTKAGFSLNLKKCSFLKTKVEFLGFEVEAGHIRPNHRKIEALTALPPPQTVSQLRQFIGLSSYFRQFVKDFSRFMAPLYRLTSLKGNFVWKTEHENIRQSIINILTSDPILMIYNPKYQVELHTDDSSLGYGELSQNWLQAEQQRDVEISKIISDLNSGQLDESIAKTYELRAVEVNENKSWQDAIGDVQLAINCTFNRVTKASPLELLIGKVARPLSLMCNDVDTSVDIDQIREVASENVGSQEINTLETAIEPDPIPEPEQASDLLTSESAQNMLPVETFRNICARYRSRFFEVKTKLLKEYPVPDNCRLLKAPILNAEISAAVAKVVRNRDKSIQSKQDQLGQGIAAINKALTLLLLGDDKAGARRAAQSSSGPLSPHSHSHSTDDATRHDIIQPTETTCPAPVIQRNLAVVCDGKIWLTASYINTKDNKEADEESRKVNPNIELSLRITNTKALGVAKLSGKLSPNAELPIHP